MGKVKVFDPDELLSTVNPVFVAFLFYAALCLLMVVGLEWLTTRLRHAKQVFATPEDVQAFCKDKEKKPILDDDEVERLRRNHLSDLENVMPFVMLGVLFISVNPHPMLACWLFRLFAASRLLHTASYQMPERLPKPCRFYSYIGGSSVNGIMALHVIISTFMV